MNAPAPEAEKIIRCAFACIRALDWVLGQCTQGEDKPETTVRDNAARNAIAHHFDHLRSCYMDQNALDPYKFLCWYGWALLESVVPSERPMAEQVIKATLLTLNFVLAKERHRSGAGLTESSLRLLETMLFYEWDGTGKHGIGKNGLYVAYHCAASNGIK